MYQSVQTEFSSFTTRFEGRVHWMYVDIKGLVTTGIGNLIDPVSLATPLPFTHSATGAAATQAEITAAWTDLKNNSATLAKAGYTACASRNDLRLSDAAIDKLVNAKLASNEAIFIKSFPDFASWPADAQLAAMSMCWALGPGFAPQWPKLSAALRAKDWTTAAANAAISTAGNPGVAPRNTADIALFTNAAAVAKNGADPSVVYYPGTVPTHPAGTPGTSGSHGTTTGSAGNSGPTDTSGATDSTDSTDTSGADTSGTDSTDSSGTDTSGADTSGADTSGADTSGTDSTDSSGTDTSGADTSGTDSTDSSGTDTSGADTSGADTSGTDSTDSSGTDTSGTDTGSSADGSATDTSGSADGSATDTSGTDTSGSADGSATDTSGADTSGADTSGSADGSTETADTSGSSDSGADPAAVGADSSAG